MAESIIAVQVENRHFIELLRPREKKEGVLHLTTIEKNQRVALVHIFIQQRGKRRPLHTFRIDPVPPGKKGVPKIDLIAEKKSGAITELKLFVEDKLYDQTAVHIKKPFRKNVWKWAVIGALGLAAVLVFVFGTRFFTGEQGGGQRQPVEATETDERGPADDSADVAEEPPVDDGTDSEAPTPQDDGPDSEAPSATDGAVEAESEAPSSNDAVDTKDEASSGTPPAEAEEPSAISEPTDEETQPPSGSADSGTGVPSAESEEKAGEVGATETVNWTIYFNPDSDVLTPDSRVKLQAVSERLKQHPDGMVTIAGHCALYGTESGRISLSKERAQTVASYLRGQTWKPEEGPELEWYGAKRYLTDDRDMQHLNRRVEIELSY